MNKWTKQAPNKVGQLQLILNIQIEHVVSLSLKKKPQNETTDVFVSIGVGLKKYI